MKVTEAVAAAVLCLYLVPLGCTQAVAWKEEKDLKNWQEYSARYSLFESPRRDTSSCQILVTRDGTTMYVTATDVHYKFTKEHDPKQSEWEMVQTLKFIKKPDGTVDYKVGWSASRAGGLMDRPSGPSLKTARHPCSSTSGRQAPRAFQRAARLTVRHSGEPRTL